MSTQPKPYERKPYKQYSREFKLEAIRLAEIGDKTASEVARSLNEQRGQVRIFCESTQQPRVVPLGPPAPTRASIRGSLRRPLSK